MAEIGVIGSGAWGTTLAILQAHKGNDTVLWEYQSDRAEVMQQQRENATFLPGVRFPESLRVTSNITEAARAKDMLLLVTPSQRMRENVRLLAPYVGKDTILVSASKGIEIGSLKRMTEVIADELPHARDRISALSGPNIAREIAMGMPTAAVIAAAIPDVAVKARTLVAARAFRVYTANDVIGVELGGSLKNIIAIGAGFIEGVGFGDSTKAAFITRGIAEIVRLGIAASANPLTFTGLAGIGDLIATCASRLSRNETLGRRLAAGETLAAILASTRSVAEGVTTTKAALQLAERYHVDMPITRLLSQVLFENFDQSKVVQELMGRDPKDEMEGIA